MNLKLLINFFNRLHSFIGVFIGPFIILAAFTGALYGMAFALENWIYKDLLYTQNADQSSPKAQSLQAQIQAVLTHTNKQSSDILAVRPAPSFTEVTRVILKDDLLPLSEYQTVFINPSSLNIKGQLITYGSGGALPFRKFLDLIHRDLYLGKWGRWYSELAATWLWITALTGLIYFLKKRKTTIHNSQQKIYSVISWHKLTGIVLILPMLLLSITGLTWSEYAGDKISKIRSALSWQTPSINRSLNEYNPLQITDIDTVVKTAYANGLNSSKIEIKPPSHEKEAWLVSEIDRLYPTEADAVSINSKNMSVVDKLEFKNFSLMAKFTRWGIDIHMGSLFGLTNQILLILIAFSISGLGVTGYIIWLKKNGFSKLINPQHSLFNQFVAQPFGNRLFILFLMLSAGYFLPLLLVSVSSFTLIEYIMRYKKT